MDHLEEVEFGSCRKCGVEVTDMNHGCSDPSTKKALCAECMNEITGEYIN